jgi:hypothetical protein
MVKSAQSISTGLYMSSLHKPTPEKALLHITNHLGIENRLHRQALLWQLDVTFKEDIAIANLYLIRKWALLLLKKLPEKISGNRKRKRLVRNIKLFAQLFS